MPTVVLIWKIDSEMMQELSSEANYFIVEGDNFDKKRFNNTYCNESCLICLRALKYMVLAIRPTTNTRPKAQAAAPNKAGPWEGAWAGAGDWFGAGKRPWNVRKCWKIIQQNGNGGGMKWNKIFSSSSFIFDLMPLKGALTWIKWRDN